MNIQFGFLLNQVYNIRANIEKFQDSPPCFDYLVGHVKLKLPFQVGHYNNSRDMFFLYHIVRCYTNWLSWPCALNLIFASAVLMGVASSIPGGAIIFLYFTINYKQILGPNDFFLYNIIYFRHIVLFQI